MNLKKSLTKTTNYMMMMFGICAYAHGRVGPTAAVRKIKSPQLNPFRLLRIL